ncbi:lipocalin family protein [Pontimicrobium sp. MEBiC06410]
MKKVIVLAVVFLFMSCNTAEQYEKLKGEWVCSSWINVATGSDNCNNNVYFKFNEDKTYASKIGGNDTTGEYKIMNDRLYCTPKGKLEIAVEMKTFTTDTLELVMSRSGNKELLTLVRK